jgi:hypothetical protein
MAVSSPRLLRSALALLLIASLIEKPLPAWDAPGHELIATMAYGHLNPKAREAVNALAREMVNPDQAYDAVTLACWMDDLKKNTAMPCHGLFLGWHYIDLGIDPGDPQPSLDPGDDNEVHGNVVQALKRALVVLKGGTDPYIQTKAMACAMVMHLVGDIHQPLHCATKYFLSGGRLHQDAGGNKEEVLNGPPGEKGKFNLHAFWDSAWRASFDEASGCVVLDPRYREQAVHEPQNVRLLAEALAQQPPPPGDDLETHIDQWARESNGIARDFVYPELTVTEGKKYCRLSSVYVSRAATLARQRLGLAAWRLATLLNDTLGADGPIQPPPPYPAGPPDQGYAPKDFASSQGREQATLNQDRDEQPSDGRPENRPSLRDARPAFLAAGRRPTPAPARLADGTGVGRSLGIELFLGGHRRSVRGLFFRGLSRELEPDAVIPAA